MDCSSSVTNLEGSSLNPTNYCWSNNNLQQPSVVFRHRSKHLWVMLIFSQWLESLTFLFDLSQEITSLVSESGTPSAIIATTMMVGCLRTSFDEAATLICNPMMTCPLLLQCLRSSKSFSSRPTHYRHGITVKMENRIYVYSFQSRSTTL